MFINKSTLWGLLGADALAFAEWLNGPDAEAVSMKTMLENTEGLTIDGPLVKDQLIPLLLSKAVITAETGTRLAVYASPAKRFAIVAVTEAEKDTVIAGLADFCDSSYTVEKSPAVIYALTNGSCTYPGAEEV